MLPGEDSSSVRLSNHNTERLALIYSKLNLMKDGVVNGSIIDFLFVADSKGNPRCITNSKGRKRKPGSKELAFAIRCNDTVFVDFVAKCLE